MKALRFHKIGEPLQELQIDEIPMMQPRRDEVLFKVSAFALNQADLLFVRGQHYTVPVFPSRIGSEATGIVVDIGEDVKEFKVGDRVTTIPFYTQKYGVQGEYATVPQSYLTLVPEHFSNEEATSYWMQYLTAYYALFKLGNVQKNDWVFIPATSGSAGQGALQLAKDRGLKVIGSTRTSKKKQFLLDLGVDEVIVTDEENTLLRLKDIAGDQGIKFVFDPIGGSFTQMYMSALSRKGTAVIYGLLSGEQTIFPILDLVQSDTKLLAYSMFNYVNDPVLLKEGVKYIQDRIEAKSSKLKPRIDKVFSFSNALDAYKYMLSNEQRGKIVVTLE